MADSLCLAFGLSPDLTVDVEACVTPAEDLLDKGKADELFPQQQGKDLMGEDLLECLLMETTDTVKSTIRGCASFGHQDMDMRMEVDAIAESVNYSHYPWHELKACGCVQEFHKCTHRRETERIEELSLEAEEKTQHFGDGEDDLTVRDIQQELLSHPLVRFLTALGMTGGTESACLAGKHQEPLFPTVRTSDAGKPAHRSAAAEIALDHILDHRTEEAIILLETLFIFPKKILEIIKEHLVKHCVFWTTLAVDPCHGREDDS